MSQPSLMVYNCANRGLHQSPVQHTPNASTLVHKAWRPELLSIKHKVRLPVVAGLWHLLGRHSPCLKNRILHVDKFSQHTNVTVYWYLPFPFNSPSGFKLYQNKVKSVCFQDWNLQIPINQNNTTTV